MEPITKEDIQSQIKAMLEDERKISRVKPLDIQVKSMEKILNGLVGLEIELYTIDNFWTAVSARMGNDIDPDEMEGNDGRILEVAVFDRHIVVCKHFFIDGLRPVAVFDIGEEKLASERIKWEYIH